MTALVYPLTIEAGATFIDTWQYEQAGVPIDLTGFTVQMVFRTREPVPVLTLAPPSVSITPATGLVNLTMTAAQTNALPSRPYLSDLPAVATCHYTLVITNSTTGQVIYLSTGPVIVNGP